MPAGTPIGLPIGRALEIPPGLIHDDLRVAVEIVEQVHGVDHLPRIPLYGTRFPIGAIGGPVRRGRFSFTPEGEAVSIAIELGQEHRVLSTLHEVGHFLDLSGIGPPNRFESTVEGGSLSAWRAVILQSRSVLTLIAIARDAELMFAQAAGEQLDWRELWARSYAQYVIDRSGWIDLISILDAFRPARTSEVYLPMHADAADFAEI